MLTIQAKHIKSKAKLGKAAWCVDSRSALKNGSRKFYETKEEAVRAIEALNKEITPDAKNSDTWRWTFAELRTEYMKRVEADYQSGKKSKTFRTDKERHSRCFLDLIIDGKPISQMRVADLTMGMVAIDVVDQLEKGRAKKTVTNIIGSVSHMMKFAILKGCRETNPCLDVETRGSLVAAEKNKAQQIRPEIIDAIMEQMSPEWKVAMRFACTTGLRQGEQRALTWSCLDLDNSQVNVTRAIKHRAGVGAPKTKTGNRTVPLTRDMVQSLRELFIKRGRPNNPDALVFCAKSGNVRMPSKFLKALHRACDAAGVERIRWHDLRHFYASKLLQAYPDDLWRVRTYMGHASIAITQSTYGHWIQNEGEDTAAVDKLSAIF